MAKKDSHSTSPYRYSAAPRFDAKKVLVAGVVGVAVLLGLLRWQATALNFAWIAAHYLAYPVLLFVLLAGAWGYLMWRADQRGSGRGWVTALGVALAVGYVLLMMLRSYWMDQRVMSESVSVAQAGSEQSAYGPYVERAPFVVASSQTAGNVTINGSAEETTYIPEDDRFGAAVRKNGITSGYGQVVYQEIGPNGQAIKQNCSFSDAAGDRFGGWWSANLKREIVNRDWAVLIDESDSYAFCDGDVPMVVVPLTELDGFFNPIRVPAGVAIYNGSTGELVVKDSVEAGELPGPVYPLSLSKQSRDATVGMGSFIDWVFSRVGFSDTSSDEEDTNAQNAAELTLALSDGPGSEYVSPLTMRGRGASITAVGHVSASSVRAGELNPYVVSMLPDSRQANSAVEDRLRADYGTLPEWAAGMKVFEIAPVAPDKWVATLGREKSIMYRVELNADSSSCLFSLSGQQLRCSSTPGSDSADSGGGAGSPAVPGDLSGLSDAELAELNKQVAEEIAARLAEQGEAQPTD